MKKLLKYTLFSFLSLSFIGCSNEKDNLTGVIENAWDKIEDNIEDNAEERLKDIADNPQSLFKGECETDYMSMGDIFTLRIPIDYKSQAVISFLFGNDAGEFVSLMDNVSRNSRSKEQVKRLIMKHFNPSWAELMTGLIVLDGEFDYDFENENWFDSSYAFDSKELYKILNSQNYFNGAYGDTIPNLSFEIKKHNDGDGQIDISNPDFDLPVEEDNVEIANAVNLPDGLNNLKGNMIHTDGRKFPFTLSFMYDASTGDFTDIIYTNIGSGTKLHLSGHITESGTIRMEGSDGGKDFIMIFSGSNPYHGDAWWGDFHQDLEIY